MLEDMQQSLNGDLGEEAEEMALKHMIDAIVDHTFDSLRIADDGKLVHIGGGLITQP